MMTAHVISSATTNAVLFEQGHSPALDRACISSEWQSTPKTTSDNGFIWRAIFWYFLANNQENAITFCKQRHVYSSHRLRWLKSWQKCNLVGLFIYLFSARSLTVHTHSYITATSWTPCSLVTNQSSIYTKTELCHTIECNTDIILNNTAGIFHPSISRTWLNIYPVQWYMLCPFLIADKISSTFSFLRTLGE